MSADVAINAVLGGHDHFCNLGTGLLLWWIVFALTGGGRGGRVSADAAASTGD